MAIHLPCSLVGVHPSKTWIRSQTTEIGEVSVDSWVRASVVIPARWPDHLFIGGHNKKDSRGSTPSSINKASTANPQRISVGTPIPTSPNNRTGSLATNDEAGTALSKIGTPDFSGFLKKKGDRYNTWKTRYFVLKGPRLYYLRNEKVS